MPPFFSIIPFAIVLWLIINKYIRDREEENLIHRGEEEEGQITTQGRAEQEYCIGCGKIVTAGVNTLDIKSAITLAVTISTLLLAITYLGGADTSNIIGSIEFLGFLAAGIFSLIRFIIIEREKQRHR